MLNHSNCYPQVHGDIFDHMDSETCVIWHALGDVVFTVQVNVWTANTYFKRFQVDLYKTIYIENMN